MVRFPALALLVSFAAFAAFGATEAPSIDRALHSMYNADFVTAHQTLDTLVQVHPEDPLLYAFRASAYLFSELDRLQILEAEFLTDDEKIIEKKKQKLDPDPAVRERFLKALNDAMTRGEAALRKDANDKNALFAMCIAQGVNTDYIALVEKRQMSSLSPAKRSNNYAQRLLKLDPKFYDAYLTAGFTEYLVGSLPFFVKWFVKFDNVSGSKERGIHNLELTASDGHYFKPFAKILLGICALREKRLLDAQKYLAELARDFPRNPLFRKELVKINNKLGMAAN